METTELRQVLEKIANNVEEMNNKFDELLDMVDEALGGEEDGEQHTLTEKGE